MHTGEANIKRVKNESWNYCSHKDYNKTAYINWFWNSVMGLLESLKLCFEFGESGVKIGEFGSCFFYFSTILFYFFTCTIVKNSSRKQTAIFA